MKRLKSILKLSSILTFFTLQLIWNTTIYAKNKNENWLLSSDQLLQISQTQKQAYLNEIKSEIENFDTFIDLALFNQKNIKSAFFMQLLINSSNAQTSTTEDYSFHTILPNKTLVDIIMSAQSHNDSKLNDALLEELLTNSNNHIFSLSSNTNYEQFKKEYLSYSHTTEPQFEEALAKIKNQLTKFKDDSSKISIHKIIDKNLSELKKIKEQNKELSEGTNNTLNADEQNNNLKTNLELNTKNNNLKNDNPLIKCIYAGNIVDRNEKMHCPGPSSIKTDTLNLTCSAPTSIICNPLLYGIECPNCSCNERIPPEHTNTPLCISKSIHASKECGLLASKKSGCSAAQLISQNKNEWNQLEQDLKLYCSPNINAQTNTTFHKKIKDLITTCKTVQGRLEKIKSKYIARQTSKEISPIQSAGSKGAQ